MGRDFQRKGSACLDLTSIARERPSAVNELVKSSAGAEESYRIQDLETRFVSLADNERGLADAYNDAVHIAEQDRSCGTALDAPGDASLVAQHWRDGRMREAQSALDCRFKTNADNRRTPMPLTQLTIDNGPHNMDGLRLFAKDGSERIEAFIGRKVMDVWAGSVEHGGGRQSLFRDQYNALGKLNLAAIERIVSEKYQRGPAVNRQHPFVEVLVSDITESGETLDLSELVREPLPPAFHRI